MPDDASAILTRIEARLGFVPPFFEPASQHPVILANLWNQTERGYLDNALPDLFKEKLAALLGRYCEVPYCLVCHTCSLRPLGMSGGAVVDLLMQEHPSEERAASVMARFADDGGVIDLAAVSPATEEDIFCLASLVYYGGPYAAPARARLRARLAPADYESLIVFTSYNRMCHEWMAAHPEVSYAVDKRYLANYEALVAEAPALAMTLRTPSGDERARRERLDENVAARAAEASRTVAIAERRLGDIIARFNERVAAASASTNENESLVQSLRETADFAQELLAIVSHDLRGPLSNMLMGSELIIALQPTDPRIVKTLGRMISSGRRAERLIHDLLDFTQARAGGGIPLHLRPAELHGVIKTVADEVADANSDRVLRLRCEGEVQGDWDPDRLSQVVWNLLANAISHGKKDAPITITTRADEESVTMSVHNENRDGPIPADLMPVLFDPFKRGVKSVMSATRSIGLGLYIVHELVRGHRGTIDVTSSSADGTTFTVRLPRRAVS